MLPTDLEDKIMFRSIMFFTKKLQHLFREESVAHLLPTSFKWSSPDLVKD